MLVLSGCVSEQEVESIKLQNRTQSQRIADLEGQLSAEKIKADRLEKQLEATMGKGQVNIQSRDQEIAALEDAIAKKNALISDLQVQLLKSGVKLPVELSVMLQEFAKNNDMVEFDETTGKLKFKSDLLFQPGSDKVSPEAVKALASLSEILKSEQASQFDLLIAGHTDDMRIGKPETKRLHPSNWHLSVHRAISVLNELEKDGLKPEKMSVRGFSEYRPLEKNKENHKGNDKNRRVEIFIVPQGI